MPRRPREKSATGIYHIMLRGINKQSIFRDDEDNLKFLWILKDLRNEIGFFLYAFCLMNNHVHLLIQVEADTLSVLMKRLGIRYAYYYNTKYDYIGHVFQDRYKSEKVETDRYLLTVLRYIHQNPVKALMVININDYLWSSYGAYLGEKNRFSSMVDAEFILEMFGNKEERKKSFMKFMETENEDNCLDNNQPKLSDEELKKELIKLLDGLPLSVLRTMNKKDRDYILQKVTALEGTSIRQIVRVTGINRGIVQRV